MRVLCSLRNDTSWADSVQSGVNNRSLLLLAVDPSGESPPHWSTSQLPGLHELPSVLTRCSGLHLPRPLPPLPAEPPMRSFHLFKRLHPSFPPSHSWARMTNPFRCPVPSASRHTLCQHSPGSFRRRPGLWVRPSHWCVSLSWEGGLAGPPLLTRRLGQCLSSSGCSVLNCGVKGE